MVKSREDFSDADLEKILKQIEQTEFERLQHRTTIPTVFIKELLDSPNNWMLCRNFFDVGMRDKEKNNLIYELIEKIENIAIKECKEILEDEEYYVDFEHESPIAYHGFFVLIRRKHEEIYSESKELKCLNFYKLCDCIKLKVFARLYFEHQQYEASFYCSNLANYIFGAGTNEVRGEHDFQKKLSKSNKTKANKRWSKHNQARPEKKKQYLEIMDQENFTTFAETAEYIKQNIETEKTPSYDTIKRWLSQASKGDFS